METGIISKLKREERKVGFYNSKNIKACFDSYEEENLVPCTFNGQCSQSIEGLPPLKKIFRIIYISVGGTVLKPGDIVDGITFDFIINILNGEFKNNQLSSVSQRLCVTHLNEFHEKYKL